MGILLEASFFTLIIHVSKPKLSIRKLNGGLSSGVIPNTLLPVLVMHSNIFIDQIHGYKNQMDLLL